MVPIPISELQYLAIANAAAALCPSDRDQFIARVHAELRGQPIGDGTIGRAIRAAQTALASRRSPRSKLNMRPVCEKTERPVQPSLM